MGFAGVSRGNANLDVVELGYTLSSEEHPPTDLVRFATRAERAGFQFAVVTDHFHPWTSRQGHAPFAWSVLGALTQATTSLRLMTGVTCPIRRLHPVQVAHASATIAAMAPGRFTLGVGTGERLNEHVLGQHWPSAGERLEMLEEAISIIRLLWTGEQVTRRGRWFNVDHARLFTRPEHPPPIFVAASGNHSAWLAASNDGLITTGANRQILRAFESHEGRGKPRIAMLHVYWSNEDEDTAKRKVIECWPNIAFTGSMHTDLATPEDFENAARLVKPEDLVDVTIGPDPRPHIEAIREASRVGFDRVLLHQIGPDQEGFLRFFEREIAPTVRSERLTQPQMDEMVEESFPASDAPSTWAGVG